MLRTQGRIVVLDVRLYRPSNEHLLGFIAAPRSGPMLRRESRSDTPSLSKSNILLWSLALRPFGPQLRMLSCGLALVSEGLQGVLRDTLSIIRAPARVELLDEGPQGWECGCEKTVVRLEREAERRRCASEKYVRSSQRERTYWSNKLKRSEDPERLCWSRQLKLLPR